MLTNKRNNQLFEGVKNNTDFYFDHSFSINCANKEDIIEGKTDLITDIGINTENDKITDTKPNQEKENTYQNLESRSAGVMTLDGTVN